MRWGRVLSAAAVGALLVSAAAAQQKAAAEEAKTDTLTVYHDGVAVKLEFAPFAKGEKPFVLGPWRIGTREEHTADPHPNLYVVVAGTQYTSKIAPELDHNLVINTLPTTGDAVSWDVIWVVVIDPALRTDFKDEHDLLLAAQETFTPSDLFDFSDVPGRAILRDYLNVKSYRDLAVIRDAQGDLPRLILKPAGFSIKAAAPVAAESISH